VRIEGEDGESTLFIIGIKTLADQFLMVSSRFKSLTYELALKEDMKRNFWTDLDETKALFATCVVPK
jgi:hypothetical protein